ncbi:MAG: hypothetical protein ACTS8V_00970 [Arsenophonus sp. ER-QC15-MAG3]
MIAKNEFLLCQRDKQQITQLLKNLKPWRRAL